MPSPKVNCFSLLPADVFFSDKHMPFDQNLFRLMIVQ